MLWIFVSLNLDRLSGLDSEHRSDSESRRHGAIDGTSDVYRLLRAAATSMNAVNGQRFVVLVVRQNRDDADNDTLYVFRPNVADEIAPHFVSDHVEMSYLAKSRVPIVGALCPDTEGVLGMTHHLHAQSAVQSLTLSVHFQCISRCPLTPSLEPRSVVFEARLQSDI